MPQVDPYDLFRRALTERNEEAWFVLHEHYYGLIVSWLSRRAEIPHEEYPALMNDVWMRIATVISTPEKFAKFPGVAPLVAYMKCCTWSVGTDYLRARWREDIYCPLEEADSHTYGDMEEEVLGVLHLDLLIAACELLAQDEQERAILRVCLVEGCKPSQLLADCPGLFEKVEQIYWIQRRLVRRLQLSTAVKLRALEYWQ